VRAWGPQGESRSDIVAGRSFTNYLWGDAATGVVPFNLQPNGLFLYAVGFHNSVNAPTISSTIPGTVNLQVAITTPVCGARFLVGSAVALSSTVRVTSVAPYTYRWTSSRDGLLGTAASLSVSALSVGSHVVVLEARDGAGILSRAAVTVAVGQAGGAACVSGDTCLSGYCTGGTCCAPGVCGKVQIMAGEVFLKGDYIELGLHAAGSFGTVQVRSRV
jgi:hypothetical protein